MKSTTKNSMRRQLGALRMFPAARGHADHIEHVLDHTPARLDWRPRVACIASDAADRHAGSMAGQFLRSISAGARR